MAEYARDKHEELMLRLPDGLRDRIKAAAEANDRSMNAEIAATLKEAYPDQTASLADYVRAALERILDLSDILAAGQLNPAQKAKAKAEISDLKAVLSLLQRELSQARLTAVAPAHLAGRNLRWNAGKLPPTSSDE